jgi:hypothetical protein
MYVEKLWFSTLKKYCQSTVARLVEYCGEFVGLLTLCRKAVVNYNNNNNNNIYSGI